MTAESNRAAGRPSAEDPWTVLGLVPGVSPEEIRAAWLREVRIHPPEDDPDGFERVRDAYESLRDPLTRVRRALERDELRDPLEALAEGSGRRRFVGPEPWLAAIEGG